jgi:methylated-DNA-protein-cysteine methyltransferase related protein
LAGGKKESGMYQRIYETVRSIPKGKVSTYGRVAKLAGGCSARNVGYAMAALPHGSDVPWQRVINAKGQISLRSEGEGGQIQQQVLEAEGLEFKENGSVDLGRFCWP